MKQLSALLFFTVAILVIGCGGGGSSTPPPTPTPTPTPVPTPAAVVVTPSSLKIPLGGSQQFTATGSGTPVNWSVNGVQGGDATVGTITASGLYSAPFTFPNGQNQFNITATSQADSTKSANAPTTVVYPNDNAGFQAQPIKFGTSGGDTQDVSATACCIGTLGSLMKRGTTLFILSNNHVLGKSDQGTITASDTIDQPGPTGCFGSETQVGTTTTRAPLKPANGTNGPAPSNVDAAIAQISSVGAVDTSGSILDLGAAGPTSIASAAPSATIAVPKAVALANEGVAKSGRTTGLTCSTLTSFSTDLISVDYEQSCGGAHAFTAIFNGQVVVNGGSFSAGGDSGSLIVTSDTARPLALLFAGNTVSTVGNPLLDSVDTKGNPVPGVLSAFNNGTAPSIVGGADHAVSCAPTDQAQSTVAPQSATVPLKETHFAEAVRQRHGQVLMTANPAIRSIDVGASSDSPNEAALVVHLSSASQPIPPLIEGVRTKVVYDSGVAVPLLTSDNLNVALAAKDNHKFDLVRPGIQGVGVGRSDDSPGEPAIVVYTIKGELHQPIPAIIDGIRTKIIEGERFRASGWNSQLEPRSSDCPKVRSSLTK